MKEKITPFNTGKVLIGSAYVRDARPALTASEERLQSALLADTGRQSRRPAPLISKLTRLFSFI